MTNKSMADWVAVMDGPPEEIGLAEWTEKVFAVFEAEDIKLTEESWLMAINQLSGILGNETKFEEKYPNQKHGKNSLDIDNYTGIWQDNLRTIHQVFLSFWHASDRTLSPQDSLALFRNISQHRPKIFFEDKNLNTAQHTWLEIFARAEFGSFGGSGFLNIIKERGFSLDDPDKMLSPEAVLDVIQGGNGGCPALHAKFKDKDLINRLGKLFYDNLEAWYLEKYGAEALAKVTATEIRGTVKCPHKK